MSLNKNHYALIIGVSHYPNLPERDNLKAAAEDAEKFRDWSTNTTIGGRIPTNNCKILTSPTPKSSTRSLPDHHVIDNALHDILKKAKCSESNRLYFYFSGHGNTSDNGFGKGMRSVNLCLREWGPERKSCSIDSAKYTDQILATGCFSDVIFIFDCCRSKDIKVGGLSSSLSFVCGSRNQSGVNIFEAFATTQYKAAFESEGSDGIHFGVFTRALISGLNGAAKKTDHHVGVKADELKNFLDNEVERLAEDKKKIQIPKVNNGLSNNTVFGSATLSGDPGMTTNVRLSFSPDRSGEILLEDPQLNIVRKDNVNTGPWQLKLEKGTYTLTEISSGQSDTIRFKPQMEVYDVEF